MNEVVVRSLTNSLKELINKAYESIQTIIHTDDDDKGDKNASKLPHKNNNDDIFLDNLRTIDHQLHQLQLRSDTNTSSGSGSGSANNNNNNNNGSSSGSSSVHNSKNRLINASTMSPKLDVQTLFQKRDMEADRLQLCIQVGGSCGCCG